MNSSSCWELFVSDEMFNLAEDLGAVVVQCRDGREESQSGRGQN